MLENDPRECLLVLGMHRSGTSALTGLLVQLGAARPQRELAANAGNQKGFFEPLEINGIHDRLLHQLGTSWWDWTAVPSPWFDSPDCAGFRGELAAAVREDFSGAAPFVLKDPRICRLMPLWLEVIAAVEAAPTAIHVFRHPVEVANSLAARNALPADQTLLVWLRHELEAERATRPLPRSFLSYPHLLDDWRAEFAITLDKLCLGLTHGPGANAEKPDTFLDDALRHQRTESREPPPGEWLRETYGALHQLRIDPYHDGAMRSLDRIRREFDGACAAFGPVLRRSADEVAQLRRSHEAKAHVEAQLERATQALTIASWNAGLVPDLEARLDATKSDLAAAAKRALRVPSLESDLNALREAHAESARQAARIPDLESKLATAHRQSADLQSQLDASHAAFDAVISVRLARALRLRRS